MAAELRIVYKKSLRIVYNTFHKIDFGQRGESAQHSLYSLAYDCDTQDHLHHVQDLSDSRTIRRMDIPMTRCDGHCLPQHTGMQVAEDRAPMSILNLTSGCQPVSVTDRMGGLLHLILRVTHSLFPRLNSIVQFLPLRWHFMTQAANSARKPRYTLTGRMLNT